MAESRAYLTATVVVRGPGAQVEEINAVSRTRERARADVIMLAVIEVYLVKYQHVVDVSVAVLDDPDAERRYASVWIVDAMTTV